MGKVIEFQKNIKQTQEMNIFMKAYYTYFAKSNEAEQTWTIQMIARDTAGMGFLLNLPKKDMLELIGSAAAKRAVNKEWTKQLYYEKLAEVLKKYSEAPDNAETN